MRLPTVMSQSRRPRLLVVAGIGLILVAALVLGAMRLVSAGPARVTAVRVPPEQLSIIVDAAASCPVLSPAKLAGQIMEASGFSANGDAPRDLGIAGLTDPIWNVWQPSPGASRSSARESIFGLAHYMCDLIGHVRAAKIAGDPWRLGLGAHHSSLAEVQSLGGVPEAARSYVQHVVDYAEWYERQPEFRAVSAAPDPTPTTDAHPSPSNTPAPATTTSPPTPSPSAAAPPTVTPPPTTAANKATAAAVSSSSTKEASGWSRAMVNDGERSSTSASKGWTSDNSQTTNHAEWIQVDLGTSYMISKVDLYPRDDGVNAGYGFPIDFTIRVSADCATWSTVVTRTNYPLPSNVGQSFTFAPHAARCVQIEGTNLRPNPNDGGRYRMQLAEVEVY